MFNRWTKKNYKKIGDRIERSAKVTMIIMIIVLEGLTKNGHIKENATSRRPTCRGRAHAKLLHFCGLLHRNCLTVYECVHVYAIQVLVRVKWLCFEHVSDIKRKTPLFLPTVRILRILLLLLLNGRCTRLGPYFTRPPSYWLKLPPSHHGGNGNLNLAAPVVFERNVPIESTLGYGTDSYVCCMIIDNTYIIIL